MQSNPSKLEKELQSRTIMKFYPLNAVTSLGNPTTLTAAAADALVPCLSS